MANGDIKITELPVGILVQGSLFITSEPEQGGGYISSKISATDIATLVASIVSYASLNTTSKTVIGAINEILSKAEGKFIVVQTLPVSDIDPFAIYLVPKQSPGQSDFYDEYIYTNNAWEKIGTTDIDLSNYYTKTQVDSLLSAKADTSSLATVATSGNYNDLTNKPTIPQIADNVIGNDSTYSSQKIISLMPTGEATGAVASFKTQLAAPLLDVNLEINAHQASGTPTPQSPLPITGFTGANIPHTGKNILSLDTRSSTTSGDITSEIQSDNHIIASGVSSGNGDIVCNTNLSLTSDIYTLSFDGTDIRSGTLYLFLHIKNGEYLSPITIPNTSHSVVLTNVSGDYDRFILRTTNGQSINLNCKLQIEKGSTATDYEPYNPNSSTISVDWTTEAGTVYGGELDLLSGVLTDTHSPTPERLDSLDWTYNSTNAIFVAPLVGAKTYASGKPLLTCEIYKTIEVRTGAQMASAENYTITFSTSSAYLMIKDTRYTDVQSFLAGIDDAEITYELTTPTSYQLTSHEITAFVGVNNIWHDANGDTTVEFKQDIENYVADQLAAQLANNSRSLSLSKSAPAESEDEIKEEIKEKESEENKR